MARELDSEILRRLQQQYGEMSDGELLNLAEQPDDLTEIALEVLRGEITRRGLKPDVAEVSDAGRYGLPMPEFGTKLPDGSVVLMTFHDAMAVGSACDFLEGEGIEVNVGDVSEKDTTGGLFYGGPPVSLQVIVGARDRDQAVKILR